MVKLVFPGESWAIRISLRAIYILDKSYVDILQEFQDQNKKAEEKSTDLKALKKQQS